MEILRGNEPAFQRAKRYNRCDQRDGQAGQQMHPERRHKCDLNAECERDGRYAAEADDDEGRAIGGIGECVAESADAAVAAQLEEAVEKSALTAARASLAIKLTCHWNWASCRVPAS